MKKLQRVIIEVLTVYLSSLTHSTFSRSKDNFSVQKSRVFVSIRVKIFVTKFDTCFSRFGTRPIRGKRFVIVIKFGDENFKML